MHMVSHAIPQYYGDVQEIIAESIQNMRTDAFNSKTLEEHRDFYFQQWSLPEVDISRDQISWEPIEDGRRGGNNVHLFFPVSNNSKMSISAGPQQWNFNSIIARTRYADGSLTIEVSAERMNETMIQILQEAESRNKMISEQNQRLLQSITRLLDNKYEEITRRRLQIDAIIKESPIPLRRKVNPTVVIPTPLPVKADVQPIVKNDNKDVGVYLERDKFNAVLSLINNCCMLFERVPTTFSKLGEEDLRNVILAALNGVYAGGALGEAFSKQGKCDVYLNYAEGGVFIAECKFWGGQRVVEETVEQILRYLNGKC